MNENKINGSNLFLTVAIVAVYGLIINIFGLYIGTGILIAFTVLHLSGLIPDKWYHTFDRVLSSLQVVFYIFLAIIILTILFNTYISRTGSAVFGIKSYMPTAVSPNKSTIFFA